jgi:hypothetical protein
LGAKGIESTYTKWIEVEVDNLSKRLEGEEMEKWLVNAAKVKV